MAYQGFGKYREVLSARAADPAIMCIGQDGGVVTALLCYALDSGYIDGAVLTKKADEKWTPGQYVATSKEDILKSAGSIYALSPSLYHLKEATREMALEKVGYVGLPCQIEAVRKLQLYPFGARDIWNSLALVIGIFCSENFHPEGMRAIVEGMCKVPIESICKMHIGKGKFMVEGDMHGEASMKEASMYAQDGDHICPDLVAEWADISVGSIGSLPGWSTVFLRSRKAQELFYAAKAEGYLETMNIEEVEPGLKLLEKLSLAKKSMARETIDKRQKMGIYVTRDIYY